MNDCCVRIPEILLPKEGTDLCRWAVIACDQHTSDPAYWEELGRFVGRAPSTLRLTLPEIFLTEDCAGRIAAIHRAMNEYLRGGIFRRLPAGAVLVERKTPFSPARFGLVISVDLEAYSYEAGARAQILASEATIVERIPPRLKIREGAPLEFPHVMLLYDDREDRVLGKLKASRASLEKLYDFTLNMGGGNVRGYCVPAAEEIVSAFASLADGQGTLFLVGDGNHSLATAKAYWEKVKAGLPEEERALHPARFALAEAVNLYDEGIRFEAIHRVVTGVDPEKFAASFPREGEGEAYLVVRGQKCAAPLGRDAASAVRKTDEYIAAYLLENGGGVDYIHGEEEVRRLSLQDGCVGVLLPRMEKSALFAAVEKHGCLPRKTFSMGESAEKRYYMEGKEIVHG